MCRNHHHDATVQVFREPGQALQSQVVTMPQPAHGELIVKIDLCTICGSDLHTIHGRRPLAGPSVLGHEIVGRIAQLPDAAIADASGQDLEVGDRITWSIHASCGECFYCQHQLNAKCVKLFKYGHEPISTAYPSTGGFGTHCQLLPGTAIVRVPDSLSNAVASPLNCATATVAAAFRRSDNCQGKCVLILGAGMLGLTAAAMASEQGATQIIVVDPNESRLKLATQFGATAVATQLSTARDEVQSVTDGRGADVAFDFSGNNDAVLAAIHFLRIGGEAVLVGSVSPTESVLINPETVVRRWLRISGVHNYIAQDLVAAVQFLVSAAERYPFASLVTATYALDDINQAIAHASDGTGIRIGVSG